MESLVEIIKRLKTSEIRNLVDTRLREFRETGSGSSSKIAEELCFCILTANFNAEKSIDIQKKIGDEFFTLSESQLAKKLGALGHRFPNKRAKYIVEAREYKDSLRDIMESFSIKNELREWLVENVQGIGYKEASHFLRNVGHNDFAIIDFHIINVLVKHNLTKRPKALTKGKYLEIEDTLRRIAGRLGLNLAQLDLYLWYTETGRVLK